MLERMMKKVDMFVCSLPAMRACASWTEAVDAFPVTGISLPGELDFASLALLLTGSAAPALLPANIAGRDLCMFREDMAQALGELAADEVNELAVAWSAMAPWAGSAVNPFDLAGFLLELQANWQRCATPGKAVLLWLEA
ncbi:hypothetical protein D3C81_97620 [compost metagenome]